MTGLISTERQQLSAILHIVLGESFDEWQQGQTGFESNVEWLNHLLDIHKQFCSSVECGATTQPREHSLDPNDVTSKNLACLAEQEEEPQSRRKRRCCKTGASHTVEETTERVRPKTEPSADEAGASGICHVLKRRRMKRTKSSPLNSDRVHEGASVSGVEDDTDDTHGYCGGDDTGDTHGHHGEDNEGDTHGYHGEDDMGYTHGYRDDGLHSDYWGGAGKSDNEENHENLDDKAIHNRDEELTHDEISITDRPMSVRSNTTRSKQERRALNPAQLSESDNAYNTEPLVSGDYDMIGSEPAIIKLHSLQRYSKLGFMEQTGEKFRCNLCMFTSKYSDSMRNHVKFVHLIQVSRFRCLLCSHYFKRRKDLKKHLRNLHSYVAPK